MSRAISKWDHIILGGGIVGLAVAARLAPRGSTLLLERNSAPLCETSTHNSGVVHSGMYYPKDSLKTKLCIEGNQWIWDKSQIISSKKCGKWIIATDDSEVSKLHELKNALSDRGMPSRWVSRAERASKEPELACVECLESPETGIVDVHSLAQYFENEIDEAGGVILKRTAPSIFNGSSIDSIDGNSGCYRLELSDAERSIVEAPVVVNCAGLFASRVAASLRGLSSAAELPREMQQNLARGCYFALSGKPLLGRLVYPCPLPGLASLGTHSVIDLSGTSLFFGPTIEFIQDAAESEALLDNDAHRYQIPLHYESTEYLDSVAGAVSKYLPNVDRSKLRSAFVGIRPKLARKGEPFRDFFIEVDSTITTNGGAKVVNLLGIESPGLTACAAIGGHVERMLYC